MNQHTNNITPLRPSRAQLMAFMAKGWSVLEHLHNPSWEQSTYYGYERGVPVCACATGAGAYAAKVGVSTFERWLDEAGLDVRKIAEISDRASGRTEALRNIECYVAFIDGWIAKQSDLPATLNPYNGEFTDQLEFFIQWNHGFVTCIKAEADAKRRRP